MIEAASLPAAGRRGSLGDPGRGDTVGMRGGRRESTKHPPPTRSLSFGRLKPPVLQVLSKGCLIQRGTSALPASGCVLFPQH